MAIDTCHLLSLPSHYTPALSEGQVEHTRWMFKLNVGKDRSFLLSLGRDRINQHTCIRRRKKKTLTRCVQWRRVFSSEKFRGPFWGAEGGGDLADEGWKRARKTRSSNFPFSRARNPFEHGACAFE